MVAVWRPSSPRPSNRLLTGDQVLLSPGFNCLWLAQLTASRAAHVPLVLKWSSGPVAVLLRWPVRRSFLWWVFRFNLKVWCFSIETLNAPAISFTIRIWESFKSVLSFTLPLWDFVRAWGMVWGESATSLPTVCLYLWEIKEILIVSIVFYCSTNRLVLK